MHGFDIGAAGRAYGVDVIDFGAHRGGGLLAHNGTGIMLAVMDAQPQLRWVVDFSRLHQPVPARLRWFLDCVSQLAPIAVAALVFFADRPEAAADALSHVTCPLVVIGNHDLDRGEWVRDFDQLAAAVSHAVSGSAASRVLGDTLTLAP